MFATPASTPSSTYHGTPPTKRQVLMIGKQSRPKSDIFPWQEEDAGVGIILTARVPPYTLVVIGVRSDLAGFFPRLLLNERSFHQITDN